MMQYKIIFFGSAPLSVVSLRILLDHHIPVILVVTNPDRPSGRGQKLKANPVKILAQNNHIPVVESLSALTDRLAGWPDGKPQAIGLVAAYGRIIPQDVLDKFTDHLYNIHPSLLPKYRGASPLQQQILDCVADTGVTIIRLDAQMDHGPIVAQEQHPILPNDTWISLGERLFTKGTELFIHWLSSQPETGLPRPQYDADATYTPKITRQHGFIPWDEFNRQLRAGSGQLERKLRAFANWPGVWTLDPSGKRFKLISLDPPIIQPEGKPSQPIKPL